jgi:hypothetical protein
MNPVTSNAVYQTLNTVEDISSTITVNTTYANSVKVYRCGKVIDVYASMKASSSANHTLATGLPLPAMNGSDSTYFAYGTVVFGSGALGYARVENDGKLIGNSNASYAGQIHIVYIAKNQTTRSETKGGEDEIKYDEPIEEPKEEEKK